MIGSFISVPLKETSLLSQHYWLYVPTAFLKNRFYVPEVSRPSPLALRLEFRLPRFIPDGSGTEEARSKGGPLRDRGVDVPHPSPPTGPEAATGAPHTHRLKRSRQQQAQPESGPQPPTLPGRHPCRPRQSSRSRGPLDRDVHCNACRETCRERPGLQADDPSETNINQAAIGAEKWSIT